MRLQGIGEEPGGLNFSARIEEQADRLHQLILDMLQLARVEAGREAFEITDVPVIDAVTASVEYHLSSAESKRISLRIDPPEEAYAVRADREGFRTILDNLLDNAVKYTPSGGTVTVRWHGQEGRVALQVEDNGIGRNSSKRYSQSANAYPSRGISLTERRISLLNSLHEMDVNLEIKDLVSAQGRPAGTRVNFSIPFKND